MMLLMLLMLMLIGIWRKMINENVTDLAEAAREIAKLKADNERLRTALQRIENCGSVYISAVTARDALERS